MLNPKDSLQWRDNEQDVVSIHRWPMDFPHKGPVKRGNRFHLMTSSCSLRRDGMRRLMEINWLIKWFKWILINIGILIDAVIKVTSHERHGVSNHRKLDRLLDSMFKVTSKKTANYQNHNPPVTPGYHLHHICHLFNHIFRPFRTVVLPWCDGNVEIDRKPTPIITAWALTCWIYLNKHRCLFAVHMIIAPAWNGIASR